MTPVIDTNVVLDFLHDFEWAAVSKQQSALEWLAVFVTNQQSL
jgi:hypothetical protein